MKMTPSVRRYGADYEVTITDEDGAVVYHIGPLPRERAEDHAEAMATKLAKERR